MTPYKVGDKVVVTEDVYNGSDQLCIPKGTLCYLFSEGLTWSLNIGKDQIGGITTWNLRYMNNTKDSTGRYGLNNVTTDKFVSITSSKALQVLYGTQN